MIKKKKIYDSEIFCQENLKYFVDFYNYCFVSQKNYLFKTYVRDSMVSIVSYKSISFDTIYIYELVPRNLFNMVKIILKYDDDLLREMFHFVNLYMNRFSRLKSKIANYVNDYKLSFVTLTFDDDSLKYASDRYVRNKLNLLNVPYIANIDYGSKNERLHYHCIVCSQDIDLNFWTVGLINVKRFNNNVDCISHYILKLTNHAFKQCNKVIYSRKKRKKCV